MKTYQHPEFLFVFLSQLSRATINLAVAVAFILILLPYSAAQNEAFLSSPPPPSKSDGFLFDAKLHVNPSMVIIFVCLLSAFFIMGCVSVSIRHCSQIEHPDSLADDNAPGSRRQRPRRAQPRGLDSSIIDGFPVFQYSDVKELRLGKGGLECAVCLNEFEDDETLRLIPKCSHVFHPDCIGAWLASHATCPVCRANLDRATGADDDQGEDGDPGLEVNDLVSELPISVSNQELSNSAHEINNLGIHIHIGSPELINQCQSTTRNFLKKTGSNRKFPRSYSTGHALVQRDKNCERFTLRLPEEVRIRLINSELNREKSCVAFTRVRSSTKGFRRSISGGGRIQANSTNYRRFDQVRRSEELGDSISPAFSSGAGPTMEGISGEKSTTTNLRNLLKAGKSFKAPLERLFSGRERKDFSEERSFNRLRLDDDSSV